MRVPELAKKHQTLPRRLFEDLCCLAASLYLGGESLRFAHPRTELPAHFGKAVTTLCARLGEGQEFRKQPTLHSKDATLDVVAWKHFPDGLSGKLVLFGQCASGGDWNSKLGALQPLSFCEQWMIEVPPSDLLRGFFVPHRIPYDSWSWTNRRGGILLDRCRIAHWTSSDQAREPLEQITDWVEEALQDEARQEAAA